MADVIVNGEVREVWCIVCGLDWMDETFGECDVRRDEDGNWELTEEEFAWWEDWARREEKIAAKAEELGEEAEEAIIALGRESNDLDEIHCLQEAYLGLL